MKKFFSYIPLFIVFLLVLTIFDNWFFGGLISGGDFGFYHRSMYLNHHLYPYSWIFAGNGGMGGVSYLFACINIIVGIPLVVYGSTLNIDWNVLERISFFLPFLLISAFSTHFLTKRIFGEVDYWPVTFLIFTLNTYILTVVGGGQVILALSYALCPLSIVLIDKLYEWFGEMQKKKYLRLQVLLGLVVALQIFFDLRIGYITIWALTIYIVVRVILDRDIKVKKIFFSLFIPLIITFFIHSFWILPVLFSRQNPLDQLGNAYTTIDAVRFFSFAKLEDTLSLLHPNWPENLFGKTYFLKPEFLLIPLLAFSSLLFVNKKNSNSKTNKLVLFFIVLALVGAFLAKGSNEPLGNIYIWLFEHIPGFVLFRDSSKWYLLIGISYSILIPFSLMKISDYFESRKQK